VGGRTQSCLYGEGGRVVGFAAGPEGYMQAEMAVARGLCMATWVAQVWQGSCRAVHTSAELRNGQAARVGPPRLRVRPDMCSQPRGCRAAELRRERVAHAAFGAGSKGYITADEWQAGWEVSRAAKHGVLAACWGCAKLMVCHHGSGKALSVIRRTHMVCHHDVVVMPHGLLPCFL